MSVQDVLDRYTGLTAGETSAITNFVQALIDSNEWDKFFEVFWFVLEGDNHKIGAKAYDLIETTDGVTPWAGTHVGGDSGGITFTANKSGYRVSQSSTVTTDLDTFLNAQADRGCQFGGYIDNIVPDGANNIDYMGFTGSLEYYVRNRTVSDVQWIFGSATNRRFNWTYGDAPKFWSMKDSASFVRTYYIDDGNLAGTSGTGAADADSMPTDRSIHINGRCNGSGPNSNQNAHPSRHRLSFICHESVDPASIQVLWEQFLVDLAGSPVDVTGTSINTASSAKNPSVIFGSTVDVSPQVVNTTSAPIDPAVYFTVPLDVTGQSVGTSSSPADPTVWFYVPLQVLPTPVDTQSVANDPGIVFTAQLNIIGTTLDSGSVSLDPWAAFFTRLEVDGTATNTDSQAQSPGIVFTAQLDLLPQSLNSDSVSNGPRIIYGDVVAVFPDSILSASLPVDPAIKIGTGIELPDVPDSRYIANDVVLKYSSPSAVRYLAAISTARYGE